MASPFVPEQCKEDILRLLYRCAYLGGSSTLITRHSILSWIESHVASYRSKRSSVVKALESKLRQSEQDERIDGWSNGTIGMVLDKMATA